MNEIKLVLTSSKVVVLFSWLARAKTCTFRCGSRVKWGPWTEHHHLFQLGVVIHGRVREAQGLWELQSREDHLGLGCSHPLLVLELQGWGCSVAGEKCSEAGCTLAKRHRAGGGNHFCPAQKVPSARCCWCWGRCSCLLRRAVAQLSCLLSELRSTELPFTLIP